MTAFLLLVRPSSLRSSISNAPSPSRLQPAVSVADKQYIVLLGQLAAVPKGMIGDVVDSLEDQRYFLVAGLDLLFTGI